MIVCDLCSEKRECLPKSIEGKEYDVCSECWTALAKKLEGKGKQANRKPSVSKAEEEESPRLPGDF
jgi:ribosome-binding protein aMBF1 (putative translation factor)